MSFLRKRRLERQRAELRADWGRPRLAPPVTPADTERYRDLDTDRQTADVNRRTDADLQLDEVFRSIDRTWTPLGRQALYSQLRRPLDTRQRAGLEDRVQRLAGEPPLREAVQLALCRIAGARTTGIWRFCGDGGVPRRAWYALFPVLAAATLLAVLAIPIWHLAFVVVLGLLMGSIIVRGITTWQTATVLPTFANLGPVLAAADVLVSLEAMPDEEVGGIRNDLESLVRLRRIVRWAARDPAAQGELAGVAQEYLNLFFLLDANAMFFAGRILRERRAALTRVLTWVGSVDMALSVASLRAEPGSWCVPEITAGGPLELDDVRHPLLTDAVANSVVLRAGRGLIVTGSNMSGKTTFLRTVGTAALLARSINTVPARRYRGPLLALQSCIQVTDSLVAGKSYYLAEAEAAVDMLQVWQHPVHRLFIVDELFRGTNSAERIAAGEAVLRALATPAPGTVAGQYVVAATHDGELVELLSDCYTPVHFEEQVADDRLDFDYQLRPGPATTRSALALLKVLGAPESVLAAAHHRIRLLDGG